MVTFLRRAIVVISFLCLLAGVSVEAQELVLEQSEAIRAEVVEILSQEVRTIPGTETEHIYQTIKAKILTGVRKGEVLTVENDYLELEVGDVFYLNHSYGGVDGRDIYAVSDPYRLPAIFFFVGLFIVAVLLLGGIQGLRGLLALSGSILLIFYVLLPSVIAGYSPILVSLAVASLIIILGSYITHGFNRTTTSAVIGMLITITFTSLLAYFAVTETKLSGYESDEAVYLNFDTKGTLDLAGLLLGGIMIGLLGVLYDVAIAQAISVEELFRAGRHQSRKEVYLRALRMGREHIGALVNTLAIAYVGVSLPLLLLFYISSADPLITLNREIFATEIIRTMIGSIGLVLAVPITTAIAVYMLVKKKEK